MPNISARPQNKDQEGGKARKDPQFKPTTGGFHELRLDRADPNKSYVAVDMSVGEMRDAYLAMGYRPVEASEDGPTFVAGVTQKPGSVVESRGLTLMAIDKEVRDQIDAEMLAGTRARMKGVREAVEVKQIRRDYSGNVGSGAGIEPLDGETEFVEISPRGVE